MYKVIVNGEVIGICDSPRFIRVNEDSNSLVQTDELHAQGIALNGKPYNLPNHQEIMIDEVVKIDEGTDHEGVLVDKVVAPEALVFEVDGGEYAFSTENRVSVTEKANTDIQLALCEVYEQLIALSE